MFLLAGTTSGVQEVTSDYFSKREKQPKLYAGQWKYMSFFNVVAFTIQALVVPCDKFLDSLTVELFFQILHNGIDLGYQCVMCREPFPTQIYLYPRGGDENRMAPNGENALRGIFKEKFTGFHQVL